MQSVESVAVNAASKTVSLKMAGDRLTRNIQTKIRKTPQERQCDTSFTQIKM